MQIITSFRQMPSSVALREYGESKVSRLERYFNGLMEAKVTFSAGKTSQKAEVQVKGQGLSLRGEETAQDAYAALDLVVDKLSRQLKKHHEKVKDHKAPAAGRKAKALAVEAPAPKASRKSAAPARPEIAFRQTVSPKPMFPDDAVLELEGSRKDDFLVFINAETDDVNVLYRRKGGDYGLIEPDR